MRMYPMASGFETRGAAALLTTKIKIASQGYDGKCNQ
jgi:hypothetical protein